MIFSSNIIETPKSSRDRAEKKEKEKEKEKEGKEKKKIRKNMENFSNLKIFREKSKRQFMKLVKIIFVQERNNPNYS